MGVGVYTVLLLLLAAMLAGANPGELSRRHTSTTSSKNRDGKAAVSPKFPPREALTKGNNHTSSRAYDCSGGKKPPVMFLHYLCAYQIFNTHHMVSKRHLTPSKVVKKFVKHMKPYRSGDLNLVASEKFETRRSVPWSTIKDDVESAGHKWCSVAKHTWVCYGKTYRDVLLHTAVYNESLSLAAFPENTAIYAGGNSWFAELLYTVICHTPNVDLWLSKVPNMHDAFAHEPTRNISVLLIDNDPEFNDNTNETVELLRDGFEPALVLLGKFNGGPGISFSSIEERERILAAAFPAARVVPLPITWSGHQTLEEDQKKHLLWPQGPGPCNVDGEKGCIPYNRSTKSYSHSCFPGPMLRTVERVMVGLTNVAWDEAAPRHVPTPNVTTMIY